MKPPDERQLLHQLSRAWHEANAHYLGKGLQPVAIELITAATILGQWQPKNRTIALSAVMCAQKPWPFIVDVLKHEMAHQYVDEVLKPANETAHGPAFIRTCKQLGIPPRASHKESGEPPPPNPITRRIKRLLKLGESANPHEAQAAVQKAKQLLHRHQLEHLDITERPNYMVRYLGEPRTRVPAAEKVLAGILARDFFVTAIWVPGSAPSSERATKVLEISGLSHHVELAEHVHGFLLRTIESLWREAKQTMGYRGRSEKRRFSLGILQGFSEKETAMPRSTELVKRHDTLLRGFVRTRHPLLRRGRSTTVRCDPVYHQGHRQGTRIQLKNPIERGAKERGSQTPKQLSRSTKAQ
jgi:hypothetical protein